MNKRSKYILLIIIPVLFFLSGNMLKDVQGPYYLNFYDPSYVYLINSLNLAQLNGYGVGHFDHPGTTVQVAGAVIINAYHLISNKSEELIKDVLKRPEEYLKVINRIFGIINTIFLFLLGCYVFSVTGNLIYSLLIQLSPYASMEVFYGYIIVTPDNFLIFITLGLIGVCFYYLYSVSESPRIAILNCYFICFNNSGRYGNQTEFLSDDTYSFAANKGNKKKVNIYHCFRFNVSYFHISCNFKLCAVH